MKKDGENPEKMDTTDSDAGKPETAGNAEKAAGNTAPTVTTPVKSILKRN